MQFLALPFALLLLLLPFVSEAARPGRPNILFLFTDDQRADTIAALGNDHIFTPHLDELVRTGTTFTRAYCMGAQQGAVCVPSRAMLMSGRSLFRVKENLSGQGTWPEQFGRAGYRTFLTGKWHNGADSAARAFQEAKAVFLGGMGNPFALAVQDLGADRKFSAKRVDTLHSCAQFANAAVEFIGRQKKGQPFLAYVAFNLPHDPRNAPPEHHARYETTPPPVPVNFMAQHPFNNGELTVRDERLEKWPRTPAAIQRHLADYYACVSYLDEQIGRILQALRKAGLMEDTLIVFSSDHGLAIGSHGLMGKQNLYDHSMRAPLVFAGPGVPRGERREALAYLFDIFPTLGDIAGLPPVEGSEGLSLLPVIRGTRPAVRDAILTSYRDVQRAVRDDRWKLIAYPRINRVQLFDLQNDPSETRDLSAEPVHAGERERMIALLKQLQQNHGDTQALRSDHPEPAEFDFSKVKPVAANSAH